jgi:hypothetical protein
VLFSGPENLFDLSKLILWCVRVFLGIGWIVSYRNVVSKIPPLFCLPR